METITKNKELELAMAILGQIKIEYERYKLPISIDGLMSWANIAQFTKEEVLEMLDSEYLHSGLIRYHTSPSRPPRYSWASGDSNCGYLPISEHIPYKIDKLYDSLHDKTIEQDKIDILSEIEYLQKMFNPEEIKSTIEFLKKNMSNKEDLEKSISYYEGMLNNYNINGFIRHKNDTAS